MDSISDVIEQKRYRRGSTLHSDAWTGWKETGSDSELSIVLAAQATYRQRVRVPAIYNITTLCGRQTTTIELVAIFRWLDPLRGQQAESRVVMSHSGFH